MGKNNKSSKAANKKKDQPKEAPTQEPVESDPQASLTVEQKAAQYKEMQMSVFNNFIKDFQEDEKSLTDGQAWEASIAEKQRDIEKREREELKRLEKAIFKRDAQEVEEAYANGNAKLLRDRMAKTITDSISKQLKVLARTQAQHVEAEASVARCKQDIASALAKKSMLNKLCLSLLDKNCELFLKHEQMLEEERIERQRLAANFGDQMREVQDDLDAQKAKRQGEIDENTDLRKQIQAAIDAYKKKEEDYRAKMDVHGKTMQEIEKKLKTTIEGTVSKTIKEAEAEKTRFLKVCDNVKELSVKINGFMTKFDQIKDEMGENSKKFEAYQEQVETKKLEIRTLETEIENVQMAEKRHAKVQQEVTEERNRMNAQVQTLRNLSKALKDQVKNLEAAKSS